MNGQFNAIDYAQQLEAAGVPQAQAEVHAKVLSLALSNCAATRADLAALGEKFAAQLQEFKTYGVTRMDAFETTMTSRMDQFEAKVDLKLERMSGKINLLTWMTATNIAILIPIFVKLYFP